MKKGLLCVLVVLITSVMILAAPVVVWSSLSVEKNRIMQEMTDSVFTAKTGIEVKIESIPSDGRESKYLLAAASGDVPDIGVTGSLGPADLGVRGAAVDLRERFGEEYLAIKREMYPGLMRSFDFMGTDFGLPLDIALYPLGYRSDILSDMGLSVPTTWQDLYQMLPKLQANNMNFSTAFGFEGTGNTVYADVSMFIWQHGGDWYTEDRTRSGLDSPESIAGFIEFTELYAKHNVPKAVNTYMGFQSGELPLIQLTNWWYSSFLFSMPELQGKWGVTVVPGTVREDGSISHAAYIGGNTFVMFKDGKQIDNAFKWLKWWLSADTQSQFATIVPEKIPGAIVIPPNIHSIQSIPLPEEHMEAYMKQAQHSIAPAYALAPESITHRFINNACAKVVLYNEDPVDAILEAAREMNVELERKQREYARFISRL